MSSDSMDGSQKMVSIGRAAEMLGVCQDTLREWDRDGKLIATKTLGNHRRYKLEDVQDLLARKAVKKNACPKKCDECGREFNGRAAQRFCGMDCKKKYQTGKKLGSRSDRGVATCKGCCKQFTPRRKDRNTFCSYPCAAKNRTFKWTQPVGSVKTPVENGYVLLKVGKDYPGCDKNGWVYQHRYVMEQHLGRRLEPQEFVHHINGDRGDNRIENLELWKNKHSTPGVRAEDYHCAGCRCNCAAETFISGAGI